MANIKGITVEINGETTGLDKALKNVNTTIPERYVTLTDPLVTLLKAPFAIIAVLSTPLNMSYIKNGRLCPIVSTKETS